MADRTAISFAFTPAAGGDSESRWVRIEQAETEGEMATMADAARFIDSLFDVDPCQKGEMGVGGQAVPTDEQGEPQDIPEEDTFVARAQQALDLSFCNPGEFWAAEVDVLRSHQSPGYVLKSDSCRIGPATVVQKTVSEGFELDGASSIDLQWPYLRGLQISGSTVAAEVRGSTVNFAAPVSGSLLVQYQTVFDRVRIDVPRKADTAGNGQAEAEVASVVVFWSDFAAACDLQQPPADDSLDAAEIDRLCRGPRSRWQLGGPTECFETVEHYSVCTCSRKRTHVWREVVPAACPEGVSPGTHYLGTRSVLDGYVWCEGEEDEVNDPEYYEWKCCHPPSDPLPRCRKTYSIWRGGAEIEFGPGRWIDMYGPGTRLLPVSPPDGICGELVVEWDVVAKSCCDQAAELLIDPDVAPVVMTDNSEAWVAVSGGVGPYTVSTGSPGLYIGEIGQRRLQTMNTLIRLRSTDICGMLAVTITDACSQSVTHNFRATRGQWVNVNPGDVGNCLHGGSAPEFWGNDTQGPKWVSYRGDLRMVFSWTTPNSITGDPGNCQSICAGTAGPGGRFDNCGIVGLVNKIEDASIQGITRWRCFCNGFSNKQFRRWRC